MPTLKAGDQTCNTLLDIEVVLKRVDKLLTPVPFPPYTQRTND